MEKTSPLWLLTLLLISGLVGDCGREPETSPLESHPFGTGVPSARDCSSIRTALEFHPHGTAVPSAWDWSSIRTGLQSLPQETVPHTRTLTAHPDEFVILSLRKEDDDHHSPEEMKAYSLSLRRALERPEVRGKLLICFVRGHFPGGSTSWTLPGCSRLGRSLRFVRNKTPRYEE